MFPKLDSPQPLANGAAFTGAGLAALLSPSDTNNGSFYLVGRVAPGANLAAVEHRRRCDPPDRTTLRALGPGRSRPPPPSQLAPRNPCRAARRARPAGSGTRPRHQRPASPSGTRRAQDARLRPPPDTRHRRMAGNDPRDRRAHRRHPRRHDHRQPRLAPSRQRPRHLDHPRDPRTRPPPHRPLRARGREPHRVLPRARRRTHTTRRRPPRPGGGRAGGGGAGARRRGGGGRTPDGGGTATPAGRRWGGRGGGAVAPGPAAVDQDPRAG